MLNSIHVRQGLIITNSMQSISEPVIMSLHIANWWPCHREPNFHPKSIYPPSTPATDLYQMPSDPCLTLWALVCLKLHFFPLCRRHRWSWESFPHQGGRSDGGEVQPASRRHAQDVAPDHGLPSRNHVRTCHSLDIDFTVAFSHGLTEISHEFSYCEWKNVIVWNPSIVSKQFIRQGTLITRISSPNVCSMVQG